MAGMIYMYGVACAPLLHLGAHPVSAPMSGFSAYRFFWNYDWLTCLVGLAHWGLYAGGLLRMCNAFLLSWGRAFVLQRASSGGHGLHVRCSLRTSVLSRCSLDLGVEHRFCIVWLPLTLFFGWLVWLGVVHWGLYAGILLRRCNASLLG